MALETVLRLLLATCFTIVYLPSSYAQTAIPANITLPTDSTPLQPFLAYNQSNGMSMYQSATGLNVSSSDRLDTIVLQNPITGNLLLTTPFTFSNLTSGDIAYISCDPSAYNTSNIGIQDTITGAVEKINSSSLARGPSGAVILYSTSSNWCNFTAPSSFVYDPLFVLPDPGASRRLESILQAQGQIRAEATIGLKLPNTPNATDPSNSDDDDSLGPSPTTTVAMIILYSITGIITLLFLIIIITGSIRAHRNPERYGPGAFLGGSRQGRARGIARAMLETLPIVKFGERESNKPPGGQRSNDVELARTTSNPVEGSADHNTTSHDVSNTIPQPDLAVDAPSVDAGTHMDRQEPVSAETGAEMSPESQAEAGLACSVCTDDFVKGQDTRVLPCNHKFHPECIDPWLLNVSGTCPLCRVDLRTPDADTPEPEGMLVGAEDTQPHERLRIRHFLSRAARGVTPEQRVEALRDLRTANQASEQNDSTTTPRARTRVGDRLSRLLHRNSTMEPQEPLPEAGLPNRDHVPQHNERDGVSPSRS